MKIVVDIKASSSQHQQVDEFVDDVQFPLNHSYMEGSAEDTNANIFTQ